MWEKISMSMCIFSEVWTCHMCVSDEELVINTPVFKEYEITSTGKRKAPSGLVDKEMRVMLSVWFYVSCASTLLFLSNHISNASTPTCTVVLTKCCMKKPKCHIPKMGICDLDL